MIKEFDLYFSFSQFLLFDSALTEPALEWSQEHSAQGFVRAESRVAVGSLLSHGIARARVFDEPPQGVGTYRRVIAVPMELTSDRVAFTNPDALPSEAVPVELPRGHYRVFVAQRLEEDGKRESVDVFFERLTEALTRSQIIVADDALDPPSCLLETAAAP
jgi:hypothetical protein